MPASQVAEALARNDAAFLGEIVAIADHLTDPGLVRIQLRATKRFAGTVPDEGWYVHRKIPAIANGSSCAEHPLTIGQTAIFFVNRAAGEPRTFYNRLVFDSAVVTEAARNAGARR